MNTYMRDTLLGTAQETRFIIEGEAERNPLTSMANSKRLGGWCGIATADLVRRLALKSVKAEIHLWTCPKTGQSHVYPLVEDHFLDITASQFSIFSDQPIVLIHHREINPKHHWFWNTTEVFSTPEDLIHAQKRNKWPKDQIARSLLITRK